MSIESIKEIKPSINDNTSVSDDVLGEINMHCKNAVNKLIANRKGIFYFNAHNIVFSGSAMLLFQNPEMNQFYFELQDEIVNDSHYGMRNSARIIQEYKDLVLDKKWEVEEAHIPDIREAQMIWKEGINFRKKLLFRYGDARGQEGYGEYDGEASMTVKGLETADLKHRLRNY